MSIINLFDQITQDDIEPEHDNNQTIQLRYFGDNFSLSKCENCCNNCCDHKEIKILDDQLEISKQPSDKSNKKHNEEQWWVWVTNQKNKR